MRIIKHIFNLIPKDFRLICIIQIAVSICVIIFSLEFHNNLVLDIFNPICAGIMGYGSFKVFFKPNKEIIKLMSIIMFVAAIVRILLYIHLNLFIHVGFAFVAYSFMMSASCFLEYHKLSNLEKLERQWKHKA